MAIEMDGHAYPGDLAALVRELWGDGPGLPGSSTLGQLLSTCYQAGLMREEERSVTFRLVLAEPETFSSEAGPPARLHRLAFVTPRPFSKDELRRLSPTADFHRSLIGVREKRGGGGGDLGPRQLGTPLGKEHPGRQGFRPAVAGRAGDPRAGPRHGGGLLGRRSGGQPGGRQALGLLHGRVRVEVATRGFAPVRAELMELHQEARRRAKEPWSPLGDNLTRLIGQHTVRRVISVLRDARHGGTIVFVPPELTEDFSGENRYVTFKHAFAGGESRRRFRTTIVGVMNRMAEIHGKGGAASYPRAVGWEEYQRTNDEWIAELDEAIFELAHLIAALASVDGAVVINKRFELLGFGGEISGTLPAVRTVLWALDLEGERTVQMSTDGVGTRHRSAYRLCNALPAAVAVVVSQDGNARFVRRTDGGVAYWDHS